MKKFGSILLACLAVPLFLAACCGGGSSHRSPSSKDGKDAPTRCRVSAFDYYCALRPPNWGHDAPQTTFAPAVYSAMKAQGYKVYLVSYQLADPNERDARTQVAGYGLRNFFGDPARETVANGFSTGSGIAADNARSGYGFRDFFGDRPPAPSPSPAASAGDGKSRPPSGQTRHVVIWENKPGQFFLVDGPYAEPHWVAGSSWLDRVQFHDRNAGTIATVRS